MQKRIKKVSLTLGIVISSLLMGCATELDITSAPSGSARVSVNSEQAVKEYAASVVRTKQLETENQRLAVLIKVLNDRMNELTTYILGKAAAESINAPKGWPAPNQSGAMGPSKPAPLALTPSMQNQPTQLPQAIVPTTDLRTTRRIDALETQLQDLMGKFTGFRTSTDIALDDIRKTLQSLPKSEPVAQLPTPSIVPATQVASVVSELAAAAKAAAFTYGDDKSVLHLLSRWAGQAGMSFKDTGTRNLPVVDELKNVKATTLNEALLALAGAYEGYKLDALMSVSVDPKYNTLVASIVPHAAMAKSEFLVPEGATFIGALAAWSTQAGYSAELNGKTIDTAKWPTHEEPYIDAKLLANVAGRKYQGSLRQAIGSLAATLVDAPLIQIDLNDAMKRIVIKAKQ